MLTTYLQAAVTSTHTSTTSSERRLFLVKLSLSTSKVILVSVFKMYLDLIWAYPSNKGQILLLGIPQQLTYNVKLHCVLYKYSVGRISYTALYHTTFSCQHLK